MSRGRRRLTDAKKRVILATCTNISSNRLDVYFIKSTVCGKLFKILQLDFVQVCRMDCSRSQWGWGFNYRLKHKVCLACMEIENNTSTVQITL